jgi:hypothetical protein
VYDSLKTKCSSLSGVVVVPAAMSAAKEGTFNEEVSVTKSEVFVVSNEYERARGYPLNDGLFEHMVQVHKSTRLELASGRPAIFSIEQTPGAGDLAAINTEGSPFVEHIFTDYGVYKVMAVVMDPDGGDMESHTFEVTAKVGPYIFFFLFSFSSEDVAYSLFFLLLLFL